MSEQEPMDDAPEEQPEETAETAPEDAIAAVLDEHDESLAESLETLATMQETGTLDDLAAFADTVSLMQAAMDDEMVMTLAETGTRLGEVADTAADEEVAQGLEHTLSAVGEATDGEAQPVGMWGLMKAMRDPEVKAGMGVAIALLRALGRDVGEAPEEY
ncbi:MAG: DUF1641 domain-containing protein [Haloarculaceae archaeon]